jgi:hypothetical protein
LYSRITALKREGGRVAPSLEPATFPGVERGFNCTMIDAAERIILQQQLGNGMELVLYERSRLMARELWQVELFCEAYLPIDDSYWGTVAEDEPRLLHAVREILGEKLVYVVTRKRNFIDAREREAIIREMAQQLQESIGAYLKRPSFPLRLFSRQYQDARRKVQLQQAMRRMAED